MKTQTLNTQELQPIWNTFQNALPVKLGTIRGVGDYDKMVLFMNNLLDVVGDDEDHELANLLDLTGKLVEEYEQMHHPVADATPQEVLRFLMREHNLKQRDLQAELGGQSVVSHILNGHRPINARQAKALAARFGVSAAAFL